jgi:hypothetical protein
VAVDGQSFMASGRQKPMFADRSVSISTVERGCNCA